MTGPLLKSNETTPPLPLLPKNNSRKKKYHTNKKVVESKISAYTPTPCRERIDNRPTAFLILGTADKSAQRERFRMEPAGIIMGTHHWELGHRHSPRNPLSFPPWQQTLDGPFSAARNFVQPRVDPFSNRMPASRIWKKHRGGKLFGDVNRGARLKLSLLTRKLPAGPACRVRPGSFFGLGLGRFQPEAEPGNLPTTSSRK